MYDTLLESQMEFTGSKFKLPCNRRLVEIPMSITLAFACAIRIGLDCVFLFTSSEFSC